MPRYCVNATLSFAAWVEVTAESPEEALEIARDRTAAEFEYDEGTGEVEFNVTPMVEAS